MKPIILLAVMAIAGTGLGVGFLGNTINLDVQLLGVGETDLASPIEDATIKFNVDQITGNQGHFKNVILECFVESPDLIVKDSKVFCKLTDKDGNVTVEGVTVLSADLPGNTKLVIPIDDPSKIASQVQNIHDVILVVQSPSITTP